MQWVEGHPTPVLPGQAETQALLVMTCLSYIICIGYASCGYTSSLWDSSKDVLHLTATTSCDMIAWQTIKQESRHSLLDVAGRKIRNWCDMFCLPLKTCEDASLARLLQYCRNLADIVQALQLPQQLLVTHRLDSCTQGLVVLGKTTAFVQLFNNLLQQPGRIRKFYKTLTQFAPPVGKHKQLYT